MLPAIFLLLGSLAGANDFSARDVLEREAAFQDRQEPPPARPAFISLDAHRHFAYDKVYYDHKETGFGFPSYDWIRDDMRRAGIQKAFLISDAFKVDKATSPEQRALRFEYNRELSGFISGRPDEFLGYCGLSLEWDDRERVLSECLSLPRMVGVKLHLTRAEEHLTSPETLARLEEAVRIARPYRAVFLLHMNSKDDPRGEMRALLSVTERYPEVRFILAHGGYGLESSIQNLAFLTRLAPDPARRANLYTEVSDVGSLKPRERERLTRDMRAFGIGHVLFGTDSPLLDTEGQLRDFERLALTPEEKDAILIQNGVEFLKAR